MTGAGLQRSVCACVRVRAEPGGQPARAAAARAAGRAAPAHAAPRRQPHPLRLTARRARARVRSPPASFLPLRALSLNATLKPSSDAL